MSGLNLWWRLSGTATSWRLKIKRFWDEHRVSILMTLFAWICLLLYLYPQILIFIKAGEAGVRYRRLGGGVQTDLVYGEGTHLIWPWDTMAIYDVRVAQTQSRFSILTVNGLSVGVDLSIRYYPKPEYLGLLHKHIGPDYVEKIVLPEIQSAIRKLFGKYTPQQIYQTYDDLALLARSTAALRLRERFLVLDDLLIKAIELPPSVQNAIQSKLVAQQAAEEMTFRIERELRERERKGVEAEGVRRFNEILGGSLTGDLLRYKGIDAFLELAKHGNANTIVFGGPNGLTPILDFTPRTGETRTAWLPSLTPTNPAQTATPRSGLVPPPVPAASGNPSSPTGSPSVPTPGALDVQK